MTQASPRVFVAGAAGAIGLVLCDLLVAEGWHVVGTTRSAGKAEGLRARGVEAVVVDVFDRDALVRAVVGASPSVVIHQLTDLPKEHSPESLAAARPRNARLRDIGTDNLVAAALEAGAVRIIAQSIAFAYAQGPRPYSEDAPIDAAGWPSIVRLEALVLGSALDGIVLRYGRLYGPRTWTEAPSGEAPVHVDAAAHAARLAARLGPSAVYNVAEDDGVVSSARARRELGWDPAFRAGT